MTIADTDVLIDYLAGRADAASQVVIELERGTLQTTVITQFELLAGARSPKQRETILQLLAAWTWNCGAARFVRAAASAFQT